MRKETLEAKEENHCGCQCHNVGEQEEKERNIINNSNKVITEVSLPQERDTNETIGKTIENIGKPTTNANKPIVASNVMNKVVEVVVEEGQNLKVLT
jgi:hypothetical protein